MAFCIEPQHLSEKNVPGIPDYPPARPTNRWQPQAILAIGIGRKVHSEAFGARHRTREPEKRRIMSRKGASANERTGGWVPIEEREGRESGGERFPRLQRPLGPKFDGIGGGSP